MLTGKCSSLGHASSNAIGEDRVQRGQLIGVEKAAGLLEDPLVAIRDFGEVAIHVLR